MTYPSRLFNAASRRVNGLPSQFAVRYWTTSTRTGCTMVDEDQPLKVTRVIDFRIPLPWLLSKLILVGWAALSRPSQPTTQPAQAGFFTPGETHDA